MFGLQAREHDEKHPMHLLACEAFAIHLYQSPIQSSLMQTTTTVTATKETPGFLSTIEFKSDKVGAINTALDLCAIQNIVEDVCKYLDLAITLKDPVLTQGYLQVTLSTKDPEQLYYTLSMLVERGIINYNPATIDGVLFGSEYCQEWDSFGGRIYATASEREWFLLADAAGTIRWQPYTF